MSNQQRRHRKAVDKLQNALQEYINTIGNGPRLVGDWFIVMQSHRMTEEPEPGTRYDIIHPPMSPHAVEGMIRTGRRIAEAHTAPK